MDITGFNKACIDRIAKTTDYANTKHLIFQGLCNKAKEIIWNFVSHYENNLFRSQDLSCFEGLTPIEQIFNAVLFLYRYEAEEIFYFDIYPQFPIQIKDKTYFSDFYCGSFIFDGVEWELDKKIVIECDGYESHHTKEQRNRDIYRENELKLNGYSVIRFTGTQIYQNPYSCFEKALYFIIEENKGCLKDAFDEVEKQWQNL